MKQSGIIKATFVFLVCACLSGALNTARDVGYSNYNCSEFMTSSKSNPTSVHSVRPADVKVVAALGDSLTAGNGAGAMTFNGVVVQYRGLAFTIGGDKGLENHVTIPNILLKYNPNLIGQSHGIGGVFAWTSQLNVAVPGAKSEDLPKQAQELINAQNDWKLIHIFIGGNDICDKCMDSATQEHSPQNHQKNLRKAIEILRDNLLRAIVSVVGLFQMQILRTIDASAPLCKKHHATTCSCSIAKSYDIGSASQSYQAAEMDLQKSMIFDDRDDFTVVVQPFLFNTNSPPLLSGGDVDLGFFAPDCLHLSQYGHAIAAKGLWNNLMQPISSKTNNVNLTDTTIPLLCPDPSCPFIRTTKNSINCTPYLTPSQ